MSSTLIHSSLRPAPDPNYGLHRLPMEVALKKYHQHIGNRLSEAGLPQPSSKMSEDALSHDFYTLTIDNRHLRSRAPQANVSRPTKISRDFTSSSDDLNTETQTSEQISRVGSIFSALADQENVPQKKRHLLEKFTCSLFFRKHACARCQRRSRSCASSKRSDKRYMCRRCRQNSQVLKDIYDARSNSKDSILSHSTAGQLILSQSKDNRPSTRKHIKDSGYDTVTSCSTVASAYSAFNTPANTRQSQQRVPARTLLLTDNGLGKSPYVAATCNIQVSKQPTSGIQKTLDPDAITEDTDSADSDYNACLDISNLDSNDEELQEVRRKNQKGQPHSGDDLNSWGHAPARSALSDSSNLEDNCSENGDYCYRPPRIIRVSQSGKTNPDPSSKTCYTCESTSKPCFRLPWEGGWVCEDCLDGLH